MYGPWLRMLSLSGDPLHSTPPPVLVTTLDVSNVPGMHWCFDFMLVQVGGVYVFRASATDTSTPSLSNFAEVTVDVVTAGVVSAIAGGNRTVDSDSQFQLDGTGSVDMDYVPLSVDPQPLQYLWQCVTARTNDSSGCVSSIDGSPLVFPSTGMITVPANTLAPATYVFTLTVSRGRTGGSIPFHFRESASSVTITVSDAALPTVQISASGPATIAPGSYLTLHGAVDLHGHTLSSLQWTFPDMTDDDVQAAIRSVSYNVPVLAVQANLLPGSYAFVLTAATSGNATATNRITLTVNAAPRLGYVTATPKSGIALETAFTVSARGWVSTPEVRNASLTCS